MCYEHSLSLTLGTSSFTWVLLSNSKDAPSTLASFRIKPLGTEPDSIATNGKNPMGFAADFPRLCGASEFCSYCSMQTISLFFKLFRHTFKKTFGSLP